MSVDPVLVRGLPTFACSLLSGIVSVVVVTASSVGVLVVV